MNALQLKRLARLERTIGAATENPTLARIRHDPSAVMSLTGMTPDGWQRMLCLSTWDRELVLCSRQVGKSTTAAAVALKTALTEPGALVLLLSPSLRQSAELFRTIRALDAALGSPVGTDPDQDSSLRCQYANGSRIVSLPGTEATIRGYSRVALLIVDEAARVPDQLYMSVRPMLAVSRGRLIALSTAWARTGWFFEAWDHGDGWQKTTITADQCPRITADFLAQERAELGERWYRQEYECVFGDAIDSVFRTEDIEAALTDDVQPLFPEACA
jgi:hypothetical protein